IEYQFNWGDGSLSNWGTASQSHVYNFAGEMLVQARARCVDHPRVQSEWSASAQIRLSNYTMTILIEPTGTGTVTRNPEKIKYFEGEHVELTALGEEGYTFSGWSGDLIGNQNPVSLIMNGHKTVTAHFEETAETITTPSFIVGPDSGIMGQSLLFRTGGAASNTGNEVEYQFNWGDGSMSGWGGVSAVHRYYSFGEKQIITRARSKENISVVSSWSNPKTVHISGHSLLVTVEPGNSGEVIVNPEQTLYVDSARVQLAAIAAQGFSFSYWSGDLTGNNNPAEILMVYDKSIVAYFDELVESITTPNKPIGLENGIIGQNLIFNATGAVHSYGHEVEYQFNWGDGTLSGWGEKDRTHVFNTASTFLVRVRARSQNNPAVVSGWSEPHSINIIGLNFNLEIVPSEAGIVAKSPYKTFYAYQDTVTLWVVEREGYNFDRWDGDLTGDNNPGKIVMNSDKFVKAYFIQSQELVNNPKMIMGVEKGFRGQELFFSVSGSTSNYGNTVEYQYDWGDGNLSVWGDSLQSHTFLNSGEYIVRARARSKPNPSVVSDWSANFNVKISGCQLMVNIYPENSGDVVKLPNLADYDYGTEVTLTAVNNANYIFSYWNRNSTDTVKIKTIVMFKDSTLIANFKALSNVEKRRVQVPESFLLFQNFPNPFNPTTQINYQLPEESQVRIVVYNIFGQIMAILEDGLKPAGYHSVNWSARDQNGNKVSSGIYLYRIETRNYTQIKKMILLK
ncbi:MAG: PKD domain-containing protein, partial [bacterium]|nr:PKD domain-containing protein [bacterium]